MPLSIKVEGEAEAKRMADIAEISIKLRSNSVQRSEASAKIINAVENIEALLKTLSPSFEAGPSRCQATSDGPITSWRMDSLFLSSHSTLIERTKVYQHSHMASTSFEILIRDFQVLPQVTEVIAKTACITEVSIIWSLSEAAQTRLIAQAHELASKDALSKATAIATSIGFTSVVVTDVSLDISVARDAKIQTVKKTIFTTSDGYYRDFNHGQSAFSDSVEMSSRDEADHLDTWTLVCTPANVTLETHLSANFSASASAGWVWEEANQHRFLTN